MEAEASLRGKDIPRINESGEGSRSVFELSPDEIRILSSIDGNRTLEEIASSNELSLEGVSELIESLAEKDFILVETSSVQETKSEATEPEAVDEATSFIMTRDEEEMPISNDLIDQIELETSLTVTEQAEGDENAEPGEHTEKVSRPIAGKARVETGFWDIETLVRKLTHIHKEKLSGRLKIINDDNLEKNFFFDNGELANVFSKPFQPDECLGRLLQRAGRLDQEDVINSLRASLQSGLPQGEELVKMGKLRFGTLEKVLHFQVEAKIRPILEWKSGRFEFLQLDSLPEKIRRVTVSLPRICFNLLWQFSESINTKEFHSLHREDWIGRSAEPPFDPSLFEFTGPFEKFWEKILEKDISFKRILVISHLKKEQTYRTLWILNSLEVIQFIGESREDKSLQRIENLKDRLRFIERDNFFDMLNVHWSANDEGVRQAYERSQHEINEQLRIATGLEAELLRQLSGHFEKAYNHIKDRDDRQVYRQEIFDETFISYNTEIFRLKGESFLFTKDEYDQAIIELNSALEVWEDDPETLVVLGLAKFLLGLKKDRKLKEDGRRQLQRGYNKDPKSEIGNLCMGMMHRKEGMMERAKSYYSKTLEINSNNRFAKMEIREIETGKSAEDRQDIIREFLDKRSSSDKKFDEMMSKKKKG